MKGDRHRCPARRALRETFGIAVKS